MISSTKLPSLTFILNIYALFSLSFRVFLVPVARSSTIYFTIPIVLYVKCALTIAVLYGVVKCLVVRCMYHVLLSIDHSCEEKSITKMKLCLFGVCVCVLGKNLDRERESFKKCMIKCTD